MESFLKKDLRKFERFPFERQLTISAFSSELKKSIEYDAAGINISRGGVLLKSRARFNEETPCTVGIQTTNSGELMKKGAIRHLEQTEISVEESMSLYGIEFDSPLEEAEMGTIL